MKLRTRLCIAFCILIFIPLLLTGMAAFESTGHSLMRLNRQRMC